MPTVDPTPEQLHAHIAGQPLQLSMSMTIGYVAQLTGAAPAPPPAAAATIGGAWVDAAELATLRKDAERWRAMRKCFEGVDWLYGEEGRSVALFTLHSGVVASGPEGADSIADAACTTAPQE